MDNEVRPCAKSSRAFWMSFSVEVSRALVASSSRRTGGFFNRVLAMATRCFSPPLNLTPRSPTLVS